MFSKIFTFVITLLFIGGCDEIEAHSKGVHALDVISECTNSWKLSYYSINETVDAISKLDYPADGYLVLKSAAELQGRYVFIALANVNGVGTIVKNSSSVGTPIVVEVPVEVVGKWFQKFHTLANSGSNVIHGVVKSIHNACEFITSRMGDLESELILVGLVGGSYSKFIYDLHAYVDQQTNGLRKPLEAQFLPVPSDSELSNLADKIKANRYFEISRWQDTKSK